ncbi:MAG: SRPBCC family protein [Gordonia sp. (in: high G+C Gram-positive bacteria)]
MASVSVTVEAPSTPEAVWELLSDLNRWEQWLTIHQGWRGEVPAELTAGSQFTEVVSVMNMANKIEWTVDEVEAPQFLTISGTGMAGVKIAFTLKVEPAEGGNTKASFDANFSGSMIVGPIGKAVAKNAEADLRESMDKFVALLG